MNSIIRNIFQLLATTNNMIVSNYTARVVSTKSDNFLDRPVDEK